MSMSRDYYWKVVKSVIRVGNSFFSKTSKLESLAQIPNLGQIELNGNF